MKYFALLNLVLPLIYSHSGNDFPFDKCSIEKKSCAIHADNLIESIAVADLEECRQICGGLENCQYVSHFGAKSFPFSNFCLLFSSCSALKECGEDCYTEDRLCQGSCGTNFESTKGDNVIKAIPDVKLERDCKSNCLENANCSHYTYYGRLSDHNSYLCILLSKLLGTAQECKHCVTSVPNCKNIPCKFTINSDKTLLDSYLFTNIDSLTNVTFLPSTALYCKATFVAIGGGGGSHGSNRGGGGSGYVKTVVIDIFSTSYQVSVGQHGQKSFVKKNDGQKVLTAQPGDNANEYDDHEYNGGDGYSGGGGYRYDYNIGQNGGYNGSDGGCCYFEGKGSAFDISTISLEHNILSPGSGGSHADYGGGGGGVLVNNVGPNSGKYQGEGYGGGGSQSGYSEGHGLQGMVLIEANPITKNIIP